MGIKIERKQDGKLEWIQSTLIHSILQDLRLEGEGLKKQPKVRTILASSTMALINHQGSHDHNPKEFGCRQVIEGWCIGEGQQGQIQHTNVDNTIGRHLLETKDKD